MMPHPERTQNGDVIFSFMREFIEMNNPLTDHSLEHIPKKHELKDYPLDEHSTQWVIDMIITDNEASSVSNALKHIGHDVSLTRQVHWELAIKGEKEKVLGEIDATGELYNSNKEFLGKLDTDDDTVSILVRQKEDILGRIKYESLTQRFQIQGLEKLRRGVIWNLSIKGGNIHSVINNILETNILFNPLSHECYRIN
jgi:phosphoribosylformylglycinamidine synthase